MRRHKSGQVGRRYFLQAFAAAATSSVIAQVRVPERQGVTQRVLIVGGGLAGLCSAYELKRQGHDVMLYEAQTRPGGRVKTLREGLAFGLTAEAGAGRIPDSHEFTLHYVKLFGLELEPFRPGALEDVYYLQGRRFGVKRSSAVEWPLDLTPAERTAGLTALGERHVNAIVRSFGRSGLNGHVPPGLLAYDEISFKDFLLRQGLSRDAARLLTLGFDWELGSAAWWLLDELNTSSTKPLAHIKDGNDRLPRAFAMRLEDNLHYASPVKSIGQDDKSAWLVIEKNAERRRITGDRVICAVPFSVARNLFDEARLRPDKQSQVMSQEYTPATKVFLQTRTAFWHRAGLSGFAYTDLPIDRLWALDGEKARSLLIAYTEANSATRLDSMTSAERVDDVFRNARKIFPALDDEFEGGTSHSWANEPWQRGAWAQYNIGQIRNIEMNARSEGRIHFAGEHTSCWNGWMQGALESAHRVVREINLRR
jgi:monoamine oxidase